MSKYKILYKLVHSNGLVIDESGTEPLEFENGDGVLDRCLEVCVDEAMIGKPQTFLLTADMAFGEAYDDAIQVMSRGDFPDDMKMAIDDAVEFKTPIGESYVGCIRELNGDNITVDFNHPLAGENVSFEVEILEKK
jgi:FKBP-type peptidyl-prolyl cis-trans isomerase 2